MKTYRVLRQHYGDRQYWAGDERKIDAREAAPLVEGGVLAEAEEAKAAETPENKQRRKPANKAE